MTHAIFCIDPRSEGLRRHLEQLGRYQTYGFSGFFGFAFELHTHDEQFHSRQCPEFSKAEIKIKCQPHTLLPDPEFILKKNQTDPYGIFLDQAVHIIELFLKTIGLTKNFSTTVLICSHDDCIACSGHTGIANAMVMCFLLNHYEVRKILAEKNIKIPVDTFFIPANHNPLNDEVTFFSDNIFNFQKDFQQEKKSQLLDNHQAAMIIGPRKFTAKKLLPRKTFLQSYEAHLDHDGQLLENILTAPLMIARSIYPKLDITIYAPKQRIQKILVKHPAIKNIFADDTVNLEIIECELIQ